MKAYGLLALLLGAVALLPATSRAQFAAPAGSGGGSGDLVTQTPDGIQVGDESVDVYVPGILNAGSIDTTGALSFTGSAVVNLKNSVPGRAVNSTDQDGFLFEPVGTLKECAATESTTLSKAGTLVVLNTDEASAGTRWCLCIRVAGLFAWVNPFNVTTRLGDATDCPVNEL